MLSEEILRDFPLNSLLDLMARKLQELEQLELEGTVMTVRNLKHQQLAIIQKVIEEKRIA